MPNRPLDPCWLWSCVLLLVSAPLLASDRAVEFNRDVRPILSDKCFACHGPDAQEVKGNLRLDLRESATGPQGAIVPGDPDRSEFVRRIFATDLDEVMPPPESHKALEASEREVLRRWVTEGATYEQHWAYAPLRRPAVPEAADGPAAIDRFVAARLAGEGVRAVAEADPITLIRRLSFDLTGMPPTSAEVDAFLADRSPAAYEKLVDRLLASPRHGERMATYWLDLVRYADTVGYHGDQDISQSPYRDYVIQAFNENMPYDRFVREQLAGDLLDGATLEQQVASGYNRLNQTTEEGGAQAKEYLAIYFADRVRNVSQVFLGSTMGCAQCHDHKYDPFTMRDFYSLGAFFADLEERGVYSARSRPPMIPVPDEETSRQLADLDARIREHEARREPLQQELRPQQGEWEGGIRTLLAEARVVESIWVDDAQDTGGQSHGAWTFIPEAEGPVKSGKKSRRQQAKGDVQHFFVGAKKTVTVEADTAFFAWVYLDPDDPPKAIMLQLNDGSWSHRAVWGSDAIGYGRKPESWAGYQRMGELPETGRWVRLQADAALLGLAPERVVHGMAFTQFGGLAHWDAAGWTTTGTPPEDIVQGLSVAEHERDPVQASLVTDYYLENAEPIRTLDRQITALREERLALEESAPKTPVSRSVKPRTIRILPRGNWLDDSGEVVEPAVPVFLGSVSAGGRRLTRLDLANWLCQPDHVLTSRTMVNRLWYLLFGRGICTSVDDLGGQGTFPSHPQLLDWLAVEFVESGWDVRHMLRTIVLSETYRRSSKAGEMLRTRDPYNTLLARQGRFPLPAEMVRDGALAVSGLLHEQVGGRSTKPYQPGGYYAQLNFPTRKYVADRGPDQYRRGVYTHWQRTFLHPMLKAFDAPSREECTAARARSNTPLQALALLNDPTFVEAARVFAGRIIDEGGESTADRIAWAYRSAVSRTPEPEVLEALGELHTRHRAHYADHPADARQLLGVGMAPVDADRAAEDPEAAELAAWTSVARVILNLHETITRY